MSAPAGPFEVGDFVAELLVTDTRVFEVVKVTPKTITIRETDDGETVLREGDGWYPIIYSEAVSWPEGNTYLVRLSKRGTYHLRGNRHALYLARRIDGKPVSRTDYSY